MFRIEFYYLLQNKMEKANDSSNENGSKTRTMAALLGSPGTSSVPSLSNPSLPSTPCPSLPSSELETETVASLLLTTRDRSLPFQPSLPYTEQVTVATLAGLGRGTSLATKAITDPELWINLEFPCI